MYTPTLLSTNNQIFFEENRANSMSAAVIRNISWLERDRIDESNHNELFDMVCGSTMLYAPVEQPKVFVKDMKASTGRLTDFNKGMCLLHSNSPDVLSRNNNSRIRFSRRDYHRR